MDYNRIYTELIIRAKRRTILKGNYKEKHHIVPKSMGGNNEKWNLVELFPEEHYIAHKLLYKIYKNKEMAFGPHAMETLRNEKTKKTLLTNKQFKYAREIFIQHISKFNTEKANELCENGLTTAQNRGLKLRGKNNGMHGRVKDKNPFYKKRHSEISKNIISEKAKARGSLTVERRDKISKNCKKPKKDKSNYSKYVYEFLVTGQIVYTTTSIKEIKKLIDEYEFSPSYYQLQYKDWLIGEFELRKKIKS